MKTLFKTPLYLSLFFLCLTSAQANCLLEAPSESKIFFSEKGLDVSAGDLSKEATQEAMSKCQKASFSACKVLAQTLKTQFGKDLTKTTRVLVLVEGSRKINAPNVSHYQDQARSCLALAENQEDLLGSFEAFKRACAATADTNLPCVSGEKKEEGFAADLRKIATKLTKASCDLEVASSENETKVFSYEAPAIGATWHERFLQYKWDNKIKALSTCYQAGFEKCFIEEDRCYTKLSHCNFLVKGQKSLKKKTTEEILKEKCAKAQSCKGLDEGTVKMLCSPALLDLRCGK